MAGLADPARLRALNETGLLDAPAEEAFHRFTELVADLLDVPVALVSLVDDHRQFFASAVGLGEPWATLRGTPLSHSFCQHVVTSSRPLVISDARVDDLLRTNRAITELGVVAYAGAPLRAPDGSVLGALCAISHEPRSWTDAELRILTDLAAAASSEVALRVGAARFRQFMNEATHRLRTPLTGMLMNVDDILESLPATTAAADTAALEGVRRQLRSLTSELDRVLAASTNVHFGFETTIEVQHTLTELAARWTSVAESSGLRVVVEPGPAITVVAPASPLGRALDTLVMLALTHGSARVTLSATRGTDHVRVRVQADGEALPRDVAARLLRRGDAKLDGAVTTAPDDWELSTAEFIAHRIGGRLSLPSSGSPTFDILLPCLAVTPGQVSPGER